VTKVGNMGGYGVTVRNGSSRWRIVIAVFSILAFTGCSKVNQENYKKL
jgi:hypothetical protein